MLAVSAHALTSLAVVPVLASAAVLPIASLDSMLASLAAVLALLAALLVPLLASLAAVVAGSCIRFDHALRFARCVPLLASFAAVLTNANHTLASLAVLNH